MSEVNLPNDGTPIVGETGEQSNKQPVVINESELRARDMGWKPREEFDGDDSDFIDAGEFIRRQPLFDRIQETSKELKSTRETLKAFKTHYQKVKETEYARALADVKVQLKTAKLDGNRELEVGLEEEKERIESERDAFIDEQEAIDEVAQTAVNPLFEKWIARNTWYQSTKHMKVFADDVGTRLHQQGMNPEKVLEEVEKAVRKEFPNKFRNPNRDSAPSVEGPSSRQTKSGGATDDSFLSPDEREFMNKFIRDKVLTKEEFLRDIREQDKRQGIKR